MKRLRNALKSRIGYAAFTMGWNYYARERAAAEHLEG